MNAIAQVFVDAYENNRNITPKELIDAGWTYKDLALYMQSCQAIRAIGITWREGAISHGGTDREAVRGYNCFLLNQISQRLSALIGEKVEYDFASCDFLGYAYAHPLHMLFDRSLDKFAPAWFGYLLPSEEDSLQTISYFIGKYLMKGVMVEWTAQEDITELNVEQATHKKEKLEEELRRLRWDEPEIDEEKILSIFKNIHPWAKQIGEYLKKEEDLEGEISELELYISHPEQYLREKKMVKIHQLDIEYDFDRKAKDADVPSSAWLSVVIGSKEENHEMFLVSDVHQKSDTNIWINRGFSQTIIATLLQGLRNFKYKGKKYHVCRATILSEEAIDILGDDTFRNPNKITTVYTYSHKHVDNIERQYTSVTAYALCAHRSIPVPLNVYYDEQNRRYFINETSYLEYAQQYGLPLMKLATYTASGTTFSMADLADMSTLRLYGYTVSKNEDLTDAQRQGLLKNLIDSRLMTKTEILNHIEWLVNTHEGNYRYDDACSKWRADIRFVNAYQLNKQRSVWVQINYRK